MTRSDERGGRARKGATATEARPRGKAKSAPPSAEKTSARKPSAGKPSAGNRRVGPALDKAGAHITEHRLANGLRVVVAERHLDPVVAVMVWYKVGARNEREHEAGVSHFLEHMMFKGTPTYGKGEVDAATTLLGGSNNAFTTPDHTAYWFEFASDRWEQALDMEADRMQALLLDPAEFEAEKSVVLEELAMGEDDPWRSLTQEVQTALFPRHPYRRPVIGHADVLRRLGVEDMRSYYRRFYHPGNATLVVCGDVQPKAALAAIEARFGHLPAGPGYDEADCFRPIPAEPKGEVRITTSWDDAARRLCMAWPTAAVGTDDDFTLDVISTLLTSGRTSRLHRRVVLEEGLATSLAAHNDTRVDTGCFWLLAEAASGAEPAKLEAALDRELARLRDEAVPAAELARAKKILLAAEAHENETVTDLAERLGEYAVDARLALAVEIEERIGAVSAKRVRDCARRLLAPERRVVGWSLPRAAKDAEPRRAPAKASRKASAKKKAAGRPKTSKAAKTSPDATKRRSAKKPAGKARSAKKKVRVQREGARA